MSSVVKSVANLAVDLSRINIVSAAKRFAVVQQKSPVGDVQSMHRNRPFLSKGLTKSYIEELVPRQVFGAFSVEKTRTIVITARGETVFRKQAIESNIQSVALVVIEEEVSGRRSWARADQSANDTAAAKCQLV